MRCGRSAVRARASQRMSLSAAFCNLDRAAQEDLTSIATRVHAPLHMIPTRTPSVGARDRSIESSHGQCKKSARTRYSCVAAVTSVIWTPTVASSTRSLAGATPDRAGATLHSRCPAPDGRLRGEHRRLRRAAAICAASYSAIAAHRPSPCLRVHLSMRPLEYLPRRDTDDDACGMNGLY